MIWLRHATYHIGGVQRGASPNASTKRCDVSLIASLAMFSLINSGYVLVLSHLPPTLTTYITILRSQKGKITYLFTNILNNKTLASSNPSSSFRKSLRTHEDSSVKACLMFINGSFSPKESKNPFSSLTS